ncbi:phosphoglucomutase (alpha-D-glucose-1,6-bisphosphate-dependent) [Dokdonella soli]|uniref:Phosphoglucomutase n=1 Tax=Dokdonella soli TaxID=529810 RepID=A0ABN1IX47_9GAMM
MSTKISPLAGTPAQPGHLVDISRLVDAYYTNKPDPSVPAQRVSFGTSGHRGSSFASSFNENHVLAISQAICEHRKREGIDGPLFIGIDTHALSAPALESAVEVLTANSVDVRVATDGEFTPTPAISHAILTFNRGRERGLADGIVITPSHNPPEDGGFKYNPPNGGPADTKITGVVQQRANALLEAGFDGVRRTSLDEARRSGRIREHDFLSAYVADLGEVIDFDAIRGSGLRLGVDPLGGAGVNYWPRIAERYRIALDVVSTDIDPTFAFMTLDWDGRIRMDPSSAYAMRRLIGLKDRYDIAFACDTDHDRHGIVTRSAGLMPSNRYLAVMIDYLFSHRAQWRKDAAIGKTAVSSAMIDRVAKRLGRAVCETPVGFKWFVDGLLDGSFGFGGEESAGASFLRRAGGVWTTDKDGIAPALLSAEITARSGRDPGDGYRGLERDLGAVFTDRIDAPANAAQRSKLANLAASDVRIAELAGEKIEHVLDRAPGNNAAIGGIKVIAANGWFAARPSGTEDIYKIYAESFRSEAHLQEIFREAQRIVDHTIGGAAEAH